MNEIESKKLNDLIVENLNNLIDIFYDFSNGNVDSFHIVAGQSSEDQFMINVICDKDGFIFPINELDKYSEVDTSNDRYLRHIKLAISEIIEIVKAANSLVNKRVSTLRVSYNLYTYDINYAVNFDENSYNEYVNVVYTNLVDGFKVSEKASMKMGSLIKVEDEIFMICLKPIRASYNSELMLNTCRYPQGSDDGIIEIHSSLVEEIIYDNYKIEHETYDRHYDYDTYEVCEIEEQLNLGSKVIVSIGAATRIAYVSDIYEGSRYDYVLSFSDDTRPYYCQTRDIVKVLSLGFTN